MTTRDVHSALTAKYQGTTTRNNSNQWVLLPEARAGAGFDGNRGQCDLIAINTWPGKGMQIVGHEIKVSVADWRNELANPAKSERFARHCHRWWIVAPSDIASKIKPELPTGWGLMSVAESGSTRAIVQAVPNPKPEPIPPWWWIAWMAQIDRQNLRTANDTINQMVTDRLKDRTAQLELEAERKVAAAARRAETVVANADVLRRETGIDLSRGWTATELERLGAMWRAVTDGVRFDDLAEHLRKMADRLALIGDTP